MLALVLGACRDGGPGESAAAATPGDGTVDACLLPAFIEAPGQPVLQLEHDRAKPCVGLPSS